MLQLQCCDVIEDEFSKLWFYSGEFALVISTQFERSLLFWSLSLIDDLNSHMALLLCILLLFSCILAASIC
jgi:hypothetical protein